MRALKRAAAIRREFTTADRIPYTAHVSPTVVRTVFGDYLQAFRLGGASFESADDVELNNWHERLNVLWRNLASPNVALWTHIVRRRERGTIPGSVVGGTDSYVPFAEALAVKYGRRLVGETIMVNELYL